MNNLIKISKKIRFEIIRIIHKTKTAHLGSCLSCVDILVTVFFSKNSIKGKINSAKNLTNSFILSKGHAAPALYAILKEKKYLSKRMFESYSKPDSYLEEHPNKNINGVIMSSGSLGHGLSFAGGMALADKINNKKYVHVVLMSDGECNEGSVWEAAMFITGKKLKNILVFIDCNQLQATDKTDNILKFEPISEKWKSFGWKTFEINGHDFKSIEKTIVKFKKNPLPTVVICRTIKGKGISFMQNDNLWHYRSPNKEEYIKACNELGVRPK